MWSALFLEQWVIKKIETDETVLTLIKKPTHPTVEDLRPLFDKYKIDTAPKLWELFDLIKKMWLEKKSYESD